MGASGFGWSDQCPTRAHLEPQEAEQSSSAPNQGASTTRLPSIGIIIEEAKGTVRRYNRSESNKNEDEGTGTKELEQILFMNK